jgi:hypothetical protein
MPLVLPCVPATARLICRWSALLALAPLGAAEPPAAPSIKTPPGASEIRLERYAIAARVRGQLAEVTTTMVFRNPNGQMLEGTLEFPLPDGAAVCGYALDVGGQLRDGVLVPNDRARVVLETESRRRVDPGIAELVRGNLFRTRIYPLPAGGTRSVSVTWTAPLTMALDGAALRLPLPRSQLPVLELDVEVAAGGVTPDIGGPAGLTLTRWSGGHRATARLTDQKPGDDLFVRLPRIVGPVTPQIEAWRDEHFLSLLLSPPAMPSARRTPQVPRRLAVLWDGSASVDAKGRQQGRQLLVDLLVAGCALDVAAVRDTRGAFSSIRDAAALDAWLANEAQDGASGLARLDLSKAALPDAGCAGWLIISDGMNTWGEGLPRGVDAPVHAALVGTVRDGALLRLLTARSGGSCIDLAVVGAAEAVTALYNIDARFLRLDGPVDEVQQVDADGAALILARLRGDGALTAVWSVGGREARIPVGTVALSQAVKGQVLARAWAGAQAAALALAGPSARGELLALGRRYGVVTAGASLIVLESADQYLRHGIAPPSTWPEMHEAWQMAAKQRGQQWRDGQTAQLRRVEHAWRQRTRWWEGEDAHPTPKTPVATVPTIAPASPAPAGVAEPQPEVMSTAKQGGGAIATIRVASPARAAESSMRAAKGVAIRTPAAGDQATDDAAPATHDAAIRIVPFQPDHPALRTLRAAPKGGVYAAYLQQRDRHAEQPSFFLDAAAIVGADDAALGRRVLSNLAELRIDDPGLLRVLAWRLLELGDAEGAVMVLRRVLDLRPEEPHAYRDLALALAQRWESSRAPADAEECLVLLRRVVLRRPLEDRDLGEPWAIDANWDRFPGIEVIALEEHNRCLARMSGSKPSELPQELLRNLDTDLRVVLGWDSDGSDIDLHVVQPDGEEASYAHQRTRAGGLVSHDLRAGYGPEEYLLRRAPAGDYAIRCQYYGHDGQRLLGPTTVTALVYSDWGRPTERLQRLTLRLDRRGEGLAIGSVRKGAAATKDATPSGPSSATIVPRERVTALRRGDSRRAVIAALGEPERRDRSGVEVLWWRLADSGRPLRLGFGPDLLWARESLDDAERDLLP